MWCYFRVVSFTNLKILITNSVVDMCLTKAVEQRSESHAKIAFMLASHNEDSVRFAVKVSKQHYICPMEKYSEQPYCITLFLYL